MSLPLMKIESNTTVKKNLKELWVKSSYFIIKTREKGLIYIPVNLVISRMIDVFKGQIITLFWNCLSNIYFTTCYQFTSIIWFHSGEIFSCWKKNLT